LTKRGVFAGQIASGINWRYVNFRGADKPDAAVYAQLKAIPKLTKLNVTGTAVTEQGVKDAKKFLPFWSTVTR